jgi:hypothetical protein
MRALCVGLASYAMYAAVVGVAFTRVVIGLFGAMQDTAAPVSTSHLSAPITHPGDEGDVTRMSVITVYVKTASGDVEIPCRVSKSSVSTDAIVIDTDPVAAMTSLGCR